MKHITVNSFIRASFDQTIPVMGATKGNACVADRNLDKNM